MVTVAATFGLCLTIVFGAYWAFVVVPEDKAARKLRRRLKAEVAPETPAAGGLTRRAAPLSALKGLDALLGRSGRMVDPLRRTVEQSGLSITIGLVVLASIFAASSVFVLIRLATGLDLGGVGDRHRGRFSALPAGALRGDAANAPVRGSVSTSH